MLAFSSVRSAAARSARAALAWLGPRARRESRRLKPRVAVAAGALALGAALLATTITLELVEDEAGLARVAAQAELARAGAARLGARVADRREYLAASARAMPADVSTDPPRASRLLAAQPLPPSLFAGLFVARPDGAVVARVVRGRVEPRPLAIADRPYFRAMLETRAPVMSPPQPSRADGDPVVVMLAPVLDGGGRVASVVGAIVALAGADDDAVPRAAATSRTIVVDGERRVLAHWEPRRLLADAGPLPETRDVLARIGESPEAADGAARFGAAAIGWARVPDTDWLLLEIADGAADDAIVSRARRIAFAVDVGIALAAAALMLWMLTRLFEPIGTLRDRAMRVLTEPADVDRGWPLGDDEIGELSRVFRHILRERATAEQGTLRTIAQLRAIFDNASVGIAFTRDARFEMISPAMATLTGYTVAELHGRSIRQLVDSDADFAQLSDQIARMLASEGRFDLEVPIRRRDGSRLWVRAAGSLLDRADAGAGTIWIVEDVSDARRQREQLSWSATRDPLTELINRREFEARLARLLDDPTRLNGAVLMIDLDRFKAVNDTGGHAAGDRLLCEVARLLEAQVRRADSVARLGGDEFALLLPACPPAQARQIADRVRVSIRDHRLEIDGHVHTVGASVGLIHLTRRFVALEDVLQEADAACYEAKRSGRDAVRAGNGPVEVTPDP